MADIHDLGRERDRKEVAKLTQDAAGFQGFKIDLVTCGVSVTFTGYVLSREDSKKSQLRVIVYDTSGPSVRPLGAVHMEQEQWAKFVQHGNRLLEPHAVPPPEFPKYLVQVDGEDWYLALHEIVLRCRGKGPNAQLVGMILDATFKTREMSPEEKKKVSLVFNAMRKLK
ncbi:MAG: hypothetical protein JWL87_236 [Candidatus Adlerbacteria bacterium]|nr:hypothetical protein [Candidatus Adlerbacteria bacterium]